MNPGEIIMGGYANLWNGDVVTIYGEAEDQRWNQYVAVPPLKGPGGAQFATFNGDRTADAKFAITDKATEEQQIAAIKIADYFFTQEGALDGFLGVDGWIKPEQGELGTNGEPAVFKTTPGSDDWDAPTDSIWEILPISTFVSSDCLFSNHPITSPPSTLKHWPVIKEARWEARKTAAPAMSSG